MPQAYYLGYDSKLQTDFIVVAYEYSKKMVDEWEVSLAECLRPETNVSQMFINYFICRLCRDLPIKKMSESVYIIPTEFWTSKMWV